MEWGFGLRSKADRRLPILWPYLIACRVEIVATDCDDDARID